MPIQLQKIEVSDFKTFIGRYTIGPLKEWNTIMAPNGSGKSNLVDAISFALGETNNSRLRIKTLTQLIPYTIQQSREQQIKTSVRLTIGTPHLPVIFERSLVKVSDDRFSLEHSINGQVVSSDDYRRELHDSGIHVEAGNLLLYQETIGNIFSVSPEERAKIFEAVSGSLQYKHEYEQRQKIVEGVEKEIMALFNKRKELLKEKQKMESAIKHNNEALQEQNNVEESYTEYYLLQLKVNDINVQAVQDKIDALNVKLADIQKSQTTKQNVKPTLHRKIEDAEVSTKKLTKESNKLLYKFKELEAIVVSNEIEITKIQKLIKDNEDLEHDIQYLRDMKAENEKLLTGYHKEERKLQDVIHHEAEYNRLINEVVIEINRMTDTSNLERQKQKLKVKLNFVEKKLNVFEDLLKQKKEIADGKKDDVDKCSVLIADYQDKIKTLSEKHANLSKIQEDVKRLVAQKEEVDNQYQIYHKSIESSEWLQKKEKMLNRLQEKYPGKVFGRISKLCNVTHPKYKAAMIAAFGGDLNSIVVDDNKTAEACANYLCGQRGASETFLVINGVRSSQPNRNFLQNLNFSNVRFLYDYLKFDKKFEPVILHRINSTLLCKTLEDAEKIRNTDARYNVVTMDGELLRKNFTISARCVEGRLAALRDKRKFESRQKNINDELKRQMLQGVSLNHQIDDIKTEIDRAHAFIKYLEMAHTDAQHELHKAKTELIYLKEKVKELKKEKDNVQREEKELKHKSKNVQVKIDRVKKAVFRIFCENLKIANIEEYETKLQNYYSLEERGRKIRYNLTEIECRLNYTTSLLKPQSQIEQWTAKLKDLTENQAKCKESLKTTRDKSEDLSKKNREMRQTVESCRAALLQIKQQAKTLSIEEHECSKKIAQATQEKEILITERRRILDAAKNKHISLPVVEHHSGSFSHSSTEDIVKQFDYSKLKQQWQDENNMEVIRKHIAEMEVILHNDTINRVDRDVTGVEDRLDEVNQQLAELNVKRRELKVHRKKAMQTFDSVKNSRRDKFMECFNKFDGAIDVLYKKINRSQSAQAVLVPDNAEEPYLSGIRYECIPPGKRYRGVDELSGGEKTIAGLTLLFAFQENRTSSFIICDEIDGALDPTNMKGLTQYLRELKQKQQIIMISHNRPVNAAADALIAIFPDKRFDHLESYLVTLNLENCAARAF